MIRTVYGCPATAPHPRHDWTSARFGRVSCDGVDTPPATVAPLTEWQRSERFATMRDAQRTAWDLREWADFMAAYPREYDADEVTAVKVDAAQYEHLAAWLGRSVRTA
jgi:hypothetical protein